MANDNDEPRRCVAKGKQVLLDGQHFADAISEAAAAVIADCVEHIHDGDMIASQYPEAHDRISSYLA